MTHRDSLGREIREGDKVAYNLSGDVVPGVVLDIHPGHIKISRVARGSRTHGHGKISRVKNPRSILVLAGKDEPSPHLVSFTY